MACLQRSGFKFLKYKKVYKQISITHIVFSHIRPNSTLRFSLELVPSLNLSKFLDPHPVFPSQMYIQSFLWFTLVLDYPGFPQFFICCSSPSRYFNGELWHSGGFPSNLSSYPPFFPFTVCPVSHLAFL